MLAVAAIIAVIVGIAIGVFIGKLMAKDSVRSQYDKRVTDAERRAATAEAALPELRSQLKERTSDTAGLQQRLEAEITARTAAETALQEERKRLEEQRALFNEAQEKLKDAFNSLAAQALNRNNQSFLDLAKGTLEKYQAEAKGELQAREKAVENWSNPSSKA